MFNFLGVHEIRANTSITLKMASATPREDLLNPDECELALRGTRWVGEVDREFA